MVAIIINNKSNKNTMIEITIMKLNTETLDTSLLILKIKIDGTICGLIALVRSNITKTSIATKICIPNTKHVEISFFLI